MQTIHLQTILVLLLVCSVQTSQQSGHNKFEFLELDESTVMPPLYIWCRVIPTSAPHPETIFQSIGSAFSKKKWLKIDIQSVPKTLSD